MMASFTPLDPISSGASAFGCDESSIAVDSDWDSSVRLLHTGFMTSLLCSLVDEEALFCSDIETLSEGGLVS